MRYLPAFFVALLTCLVPLVGYAQATNTSGFQREGIFGCNAGQYGGSPGTTAAIGGIYVPVNDAAVTLNTGILVYKECVLRGVVDRIRENVTSATVKGGTVAFLTGRTTVDANGNTIQQPLFPVNLRQDQLAESDRIVALDLKNGTFNSLNPAFKDTVTRAVARGYYLSTRQPQSGYGCAYTDDAAALKGNPQSVWTALDALQNPACSQYWAYQAANSNVMNDAADAVNTMLNKLEWAGGIYDVASVDQNGDVITKTPGRFVGSNEEQLLQSGFQQQQSANDIDQMVGALFSGMSSQIIRDNQGLSGLMQPVGSQPSYLDQVAAESSAGLRTATANAALAVLAASRTVEKAYNDTWRSIQSQVTTSVNSLKSAENQCWTNIIQKVCTGAPNSNGSCTAPSGENLKVSTSTVYSQSAIAGSTALSVSSQVTQNIAASDNALRLFDQLIAAVTNTSSTDAQLLAIKQVDSLVAQGLLHTQKDLDQATAAQKAVQQGASTVVSDTVKAWAGGGSDGSADIAWNGVYPPKASQDVVGWCNANNATTQQGWIAKWKI
ncbi:MAG: hypothetical protein JO019_04070 [Candidatus Kaiserbacteria bacterium]|nr:hypothetical protein [Candidatus Kaiserbacteria bacterium]